MGRRIETLTLRGELRQLLPPAAVAWLRPRVHRSLVERAGHVRHHQRLVVLQHCAEAGALRAGAVGAVEGEELRRGPGELDLGMIGAVIPFGKSQRVAPGGEHHGIALSLLEGGLHRLRHPGRLSRVGDQPVHHHQQVAGGGEVGILLQVVEVQCLPVGDHAEEAEGAQVLHHHRVRDPRGQGEGEGDGDAGAGREGRHRVGHALRGVRLHLSAAGLVAGPRAIGAADAGPEETQVVVHLGRRPHGGAARLGRVALLDGHRGGDAVHPVHVRLLHTLQELLGVGGERLHVPPLPFRVEGVEGEGRLAGAGGSGDDDEGAPGDVDVDPLQVVLPRAPDDDAVFHAEEDNPPPRVIPAASPPREGPLETDGGA
jgi:hypothetical protein